jgi:hypothetical protein
MARNLDTALRYIEGLSSGMGADDLTQFFTPDVFAVFLEFRDGRIARQRNYDCFEPWP